MTDELFVGMPTYGGEDYTVKALVSLFDSGVPTNLVLVYGQAPTHKVPQRDDVKTITHQENKGLPAALNDIMDYAFVERGADRLIWLGNDCVLYPDALRDLLAAADLHPDYDYYGGREMTSQNFLARYPQYAHQFDGEKLLDFSFDGYLKHNDDMNRRPIQLKRAIRQLSNVTGFHNFGMMRRSFFEKVGYVDSGFFPAYFSDLDYVRRGQLAGMRFAEVQGAWYFHFHSRTAAEVHGEEKHQRYFALNSLYYKSKWGGEPGRELHDTPFAGQSKVDAFSRTDEDKLRKYWQWSPASFKNKHLGQTAVIACNGPSLNDVDMGLLKDEIVFGLNKWYLKEGLRPTYAVCVNRLLLEQSGAEMQVNSPAAYFVPADAGQLSLANTYGLTLDGGPARFSGDITRPIYEGYTVTYVALQIAYFLGFAKVIIIGMDHAFPNALGLEPDVVVTSLSDDYSHFSKDYFGIGAKWQTPNLPKSEESYTLARDAYVKAGRRIINASTQSACDVFERMTLEEALNA